jgi:hypothetical protein
MGGKRQNVNELQTKYGLPRLTTEELAEEIWKDTKIAPYRYSISSLGRIKDKKRNTITQGTFDPTKGYMMSTLELANGTRKTKGIHVLVAESFIPNPKNKRIVHHEDANKLNNRLSNLSWATDSENMLHAFAHGLCENTRAAAREQIKRLQEMPKTDRQREAARENVIKINKRPKTERQLEASVRNINSPVCRERAAESHFNRHPPIRLVETGEVFKSQRELANILGINESHICACLKGRRTDACGYHFEYVTEDEPVKKENDESKKKFLYDFQMEAVNNAFNGSVLNGDVGSGKSRTGLFYFFKEQGGWIDENGYIPMKNPKDLYIITTAMKRDKHEWEGELIPFQMYPKRELNRYDHEIVVDSWNNIKKYVDVEGAFFIFDEDKICGTGTWAKSFLKITKKNDWIMLSATTGDTWLDYMTLFIANGFYKNITEFKREHVIYDPYCRNFPRVSGYRNTGKLIRLRDRLLIDMTFNRHTTRHHEDVYCSYDIPKYKDAIRNRWDPFKDEPIQQASGLCYVLRRIVNTDEDRQMKLLELLEDHPKAIIFYNFDHERDILLNLGYAPGTEIAEWSGHAHQPLPTGDRWVFLCQYTAGCEGWSAITTNTMIFFSQNYSYKVMTQATGRIDRLNTKFVDLYYYHLKSRSGIDLAISKAIKEKKIFNETKWLNWKPQ